MNSSIKANSYNRETYECIAKAIAFLHENHLHQPDLQTVAQHVQLSEYHFQRLFTKWAGISPKRFLQYLTVEYAKSKIIETKSLLSLTMDVGLSSPGRLHDLFVKLEAMSPGEFKSGGAGLKIWYGIHETPFGDCLIATTVRGICNLHFLDTGDEETAEQTLRQEWKNAEIIHDQDVTEETITRIFQPVADNSPPLIVHVKGTNFQIQVWRSLLRVPWGGITTYQGLAASMDRPTAARAVGNALGSNPVAHLIPCHRVIRESGEMGGYRWGLERKTVLLGWEASRNQLS
ncbi:methylated-DNA--[protein]-cysteine S-methyltransferase [Anabaena lutea]|uniref:Bifunctional helix-turn-helix domain-containing protein/methylated-DNA--[protein]-cysteine S-methyltransferase n=1 Tax=Anabaena lutea FACHB-196 TaxID=2692881 RepID=A0ABR8FGX8_9NOST|nr:bifunctional helix-turn-helix domain-containing protein/methylated-DNA--[protein]-cysteine S-methyltransferase [Anabaena lutea]MBD2568447.1 bifunctional helix-turn-helix domain-containing protein/methylated-DNA--[protein]-cysteine S-methyltransferase [Anabaena lutea FACHB-196]